MKQAIDYYPNCSGEFLAGVNSFLMGDDYPKYPDPKEFISGYISAQRDLQHLNNKNESTNR